MDDVLTPQWTPTGAIRAGQQLSAARRAPRIAASMHQFRVSVAAAIGVALLAGPAAACASSTIVAPGDPGSSQYQEDIPTAAGSRPVLTVHPVTRQESQGPVALARTVARQLSHYGAAGRAAATLAQATAPAPIGRKPSRVLMSGHVKGTLTVLAESLFGSSGNIGVLLPVLLVVSLGVAIVLSLRRRKQ
jgi:hypothetical protein